jgi:hypothetical protein
MYFLVEREKKNKRQKHRAISCYRFSKQLVMPVRSVVVREDILER